MWDALYPPKSTMTKASGCEPYPSASGAGEKLIHSPIAVSGEHCGLSISPVLLGENYEETSQ
jgi:hypothetical protein